MTLSPIQISEIKLLALRHNLSLVILFGSRAKGYNNKNSDTDLAVKCNRVLDLSDILELESEFSTIFHGPEIVDLRTAPVLLLANIAQDGILLYESEASIFTSFKIQAISQYIEYQPYFIRRKKIITEIIAGY